MSEKRKYLISHRWTLIREETKEYCPKLTSPTAFAEWLYTEIGDAPMENFLVCYLTTRNDVIAYDIIAKGTVNGVFIHPREVFTRAVHPDIRASALLVAHNHPSGNPQPSSEDKLLTSRLGDAGELLGIKLLDHVIVTPTKEYYSFQEEGIL